MNNTLYVVLMAGGSGTRFWPYSRKAKPKQFLDILGTGKTLIQSTYERFLPICPKENIFVVTTESSAPLVKVQLPINDSQILQEPLGRNTAPCIAYACWKIKQRAPDATIIISPSDHLILNEVLFRDIMVRSATYASKQDKLITLGITPRSPETGYGYIQYVASKDPLKQVVLFAEKPSITKAKQYVQRGDFLWNAGIFVWHVNAILKALEKYQPQIAEAFQSLSSALYTSREPMAIRELYQRIDPISIDYGVMEKAKNVYVWPSDLAWSDLGSWNTLHTVREKSSKGNVVEARALLYDTCNSIIKAPGDKLVVVQGLENYLVGAFDDVIIVCRKDNEALFRKFTADIKADPKNCAYL